jgi:hypothetical protein
MSDDTGYRFYQGLVGASFAGAELAVEAGIIELDLERVFKVVIMEIIQLRDETVKINSTDYPALVTEFLNQNWSGMLILEEPNKVIQEPMAGRPLVARSEIYNSTQYISKSEFRKFLAAKQVSSREFEKAMQQHGLITKLDRHRLSTGWKTGFHANPVAVYAIKAELPADMIKKDEPAN